MQNMSSLYWMREEKEKTGKSLVDSDVELSNCNMNYEQLGRTSGKVLVLKIYLYSHCLIKCPLILTSASLTSSAA
jgi:hypothetical protein